jgi:death-on-curing protein
VIFLELDELLRTAERALGIAPVVRDHGLLESALGRPRATVFGEDAYPGIHEKAAALLHSLARDHALVDGNKRLALAATIAFYGMNGVRLTLTNDEAYRLVMSVATGELDDVAAIAAALGRGTGPRERGAAE